ncbi:uncharacterized protein F5891DRAFT_1067785 [Suillus fuscotomentosus]|uniref:Uncharacterized protein n=1 Tax=Suillus fuscotomentosus TaxID=1912939 RepID=A0AAD4DUL1_9AGAM|nr:uncharacterized protein F5891DRAFT_1067785 [Suillus fuscotomentosus]KAG1893148.1 hypothetical protein F5891DRAFT_1067785 [Suillus fuscotomentosus]
MMVSFRDATSMITSTRDATPSTQLMFPSTAQLESVQSPTTAQPSTSSTPHPDTIHADPPASASIPRILPKPQPNPAAPPSALKFSNDVTESPVEKIRPSRMPARIPPRPASTELTTISEPAAPANAVAPTVAKELNEEEITSVVVDVVMTGPPTENVPQGSEILTPGNVALELTTPSPKQTTDPPAPRQPLAIDEITIFSPPVDNTCPQVACARSRGEMAVMMFRQGLESPRGTINLTFDLDHTLYLQIARWAKRKLSPTDLEQSVCVSFACYHLPSLLPNPPEDDQPTPFEKLTMDSQCSWPATGDLSLQTKRDGKDFIIPLALPIFVTADNCVDISASIRSGENTFSMVQQSDMSDYMFILHAHHPTPAQLSYLASCRQKREDWAKTTRAFCTSERKSLWRRS